MNQNNIIPSLRIAVTEKCNLSCPYCPKQGDNYLLRTNNRINLSQFNKIIKITNEVGIKHFSITGGEPLVVPNITFSIAKIINNFSDLEYLRLNTNGVLIQKYINEIIESGFHKIKISLDSIKSDNFSIISKSIKLLKKNNMDIRINMVVSNSNKDEIYDMIEFCEKNDLELKLFDITFYRDCISPNSNYWKNEYFSLIPLSKELRKRYAKPKIIMSIGGYGNPMLVFKPNTKSQIRLRISEDKAFYVKECKNCPDFMCQDGFCNITLSTNGILKPCRPEGLDFDSNLFDRNGDLFSDYKVKEKFQKVLTLFKESKRKTRTFDEMISMWDR
jgi:molybdenum cofactor biosynthesis enzyme MoaA